MPVPPEVRRAFERRVDEILRQADRMTEEAVRRALELAEQTRREILDRLSSLPEGSFSARHLRGLREGLDRAIAGLVGRYQREVRDLLERAHELGIDLGEEPLKLAALASRSAGQVVPAGVVPRQTLEVLQDYSAELITRIGEEARARINSVLAQGALGVVSPHEAIRRIAGTLPDASVFRSIGLRAETIYRTEAGRVLSAAAEVRMGQMADRLPRMRKQWVAVMDARTRPTHAAAHGQIVGAREQFVVGGYLARFPRDPYLPAGESINCVPGATEVWAPGVVAATRRRYSGPLVVIQTAGGHELAVTPNHPVLTGRGWVPAGRVREGDHVVRCALTERVAPGDPDVDHVPAAIREVFGSLAQLGYRRRVPGGAVDFHGDGIPDGDVDVVAAHGLLEAGAEPTRRDPAAEAALALPDLAPGAFAGQGLEFELSLAGTVAPTRLAGGVGELPAGLGRHGPQPDAHRLGAPARLDTRSEQALADGPPVDPVALGERLLGGAAEVQVDEVSLLRRREFDGHVYNLETTTGAFVAGGILVHNCRCWAIPVIDDDVIADLSAGRAGSGVSPAARAGLAAE